MSNKFYNVFIGTYSEPILLGTGVLYPSKGEGIYSLRMDAETGELFLRKKAIGEPNPSFVALHKNGRVLYSTHEIKTYRGLVSGACSAFSFDDSDGRLTLINRRPTGGTDAVHLALDKECRYVFTANFMSGSITLFPIAEDGSLEPASCFLQHYGTGPNPVRQTNAHAHQMAFDIPQKRLFVPDLGCDKTFIYDIDYENGHLNAAPQPFVTTDPGEGPRHMTFHPNGRFFYVVNEMGSSVDAYSYDQESGAAERIQHISTIPSDYTEHTTCAAIKFHPNGKFLYASNRGHDSLATYRVDETTGLLTVLEYQKTLGRTPRDFSFDPSGKFMVAGNGGSNTLVSFSVDPETGHMTKAFELDGIGTATCVCITETSE